MNEGQIKARIFLIKSVDYLLIIAVMSLAVYALNHRENMNLLMTAFLLGLMLVNRVGNFTLSKIAVLRIEMEKLKREKKSEK